MKSIVLLLVLAFTASPALAFHIGPATPAAGHGQVELGGGYFFYQAELDDADIEQNRPYLQVGYGMGIEKEPRWEVYLRGGAADLRDEANFDSEYQPFGGVGLKGAFYDGSHFGWGMAVQGDYFADFESAGIDIRHLWEVELGFPFQGRLGPFILYLSPVFYHTQMKAENSFGSEMKMTEDGNFGGFGGFGLDLGPVRFEAEAQYKSDWSAGGFLSVRF